MTRVEISEIEKRLKAATKGPWKTTPFEYDHRLYGAKGEEVYCETQFDGAWFEREEDFALVAHAWEDIRNLLDEVKRLRDGGRP